MGSGAAQLGSINRFESGGIIKVVCLLSSGG
jgi:hypothetical protein